MFGIFLIAPDLTFTVLFTLLSILFVSVPPLNETPVRILLGLSLVLFIPGYSLTTVLFPRINDLDWIERVALSFGLSIAVVPLLSLVLNYTPYGISPIPVLTIISIFTISVSILAWIRRIKLPIEQKFTVTFDSLLDAKSLLVDQTRIDKILSIILITSIIASSATLVYVLITPKTGEKFTEFSILSHNGTASNYPTNLKFGEEGEIIIGIVNHEHEDIKYSLEVNFNGLLIHKENIFLIDNEKWYYPLKFKIMNKGENQKLEFILYKDQHIEAYRKLHLWINIK